MPLGRHSIQYVDMRGAAYRDGFDTLLRALRGHAPELEMPEEPVPRLSPGTEPRNPYKGLTAFTEADRGDFFGRSALVEKLCQSVAERASANRDRFLAVLGPSGAGKSSVVMAGLIPALKRGEIPGSQHWTYIPRIVPGARPLESLADALYALMPTKSLASIETDLSSPGGRYLHRLVNQLPGDYVLLYIDQFEEVFHATPDEAQRQRFINLITHAVTEPDGKLLVL